MKAQKKVKIMSRRMNHLSMMTKVKHPDTTSPYKFHRRLQFKGHCQEDFDVLWSRRLNNNNKNKSFFSNMKLHLNHWKENMK